MVMMIVNAIKNFIVFLVILAFVSAVVFFLGFKGDTTQLPSLFGFSFEDKNLVEATTTTDVLYNEFNQRLNDVQSITLNTDLFTGSSTNGFQKLKSFGVREATSLDLGISNPFGKLDDQVIIPSKR